MRDMANAIGIFDSGVGGLTVLASITEVLPNEPVVYLGDTARVPYGTKSPATVIRYARACSALLCERGVKLLIVACNTASSCSLDTLREEFDIPVMGVVEPGARHALRQTRNGRIGVIGTAGTIRSGVYDRLIHSLDAGAEVFSKPCPLFVPLAEEGWTEGDVPLRVARKYLAELLDRDIDTLVLGCTHYPLLRQTIAQAAGSGVTIVDSAAATAAAAAEVLSAARMLYTGNGSGIDRRFLVSDAPEDFASVGERFLGYRIGGVEWVDF